MQNRRFLRKCARWSGFRFGHSLLGTREYEVLHFAFAFYGFEAYNVLVNPNNPLVQTVLTTMVDSRDYFFLSSTRMAASPPSAQKSGRTIWQGSRPICMSYPSCTPTSFAPVSRCTPVPSRRLFSRRSSRLSSPSRAGCPSPATCPGRARRRGPVACRLPTGLASPVGRPRNRLGGGW